MKGGLMGLLVGLLFVMGTSIANSLDGTTPELIRICMYFIGFFIMQSPFDKYYKSK